MSRRPKIPAHLDDAARAKWKELVGSLPDQDQGTLDALSNYCAAWSRMIQAEAMVAQLGCVVKSPQGFPVANPYLSVLQQERRAVRQWGAELRLTPKTKRAGDRAKDPLLRLIGQRKEA